MSAIIYARVSTEKQAEHDLSIPSQLKAMRVYATTHLGKNVIEEFQDVGSGRSMRGRPGLLAAIQCATKRKDVDTFIVNRIDRLSRNVADYQVIKAQLAVHNVQLVSVVEHTDDSPAGELMENLFASLAEFYSANMGAQIRNGMQERLARGEWIAQAPVGYILRNRKLLLDPARARFVREAFSRYATESISVLQLSKEMAEQGFVGKHGKPISLNRFNTMLHNPIYIGVMKSTLGEFPGTHTPLIDNATFKAVQARLNHRRRRIAQAGSHHFQLAGMLNCPTCGRVLVGEEHKKKSGKIYRYYRCHTAACGYSIHAAVAEQTTTARDAATAPLKESTSVTEQIQ